MSKTKLFLDDVRFPERVYSYTGNKIYEEKGWNIVRNYNNFVGYITKMGVPDIISFDHDLASEHDVIQRKIAGNEINEINYSEFTELTGYDCAKWLVRYCDENNYKLPETILCHSMNPVGKRNILTLFNYGK